MSSSALPEPVLGLIRLARSGKLYPSTILHGGSPEARREAAAAVARALLCERESPDERPCGSCRHCARIGAPSADGAMPFHPDFAWLARDLKTATSAEATREFLRAAHSAPYEARGQVFVIGEADSLSAEAGDALLKLIEEPGLGSPRHYLLLAPSNLDLTATLRSRSLPVYLGVPDLVDPQTRRDVAERLQATLERWAADGNSLWLIDATRRLVSAADFDDPRADAPWTIVALAVHDVALQADRGALVRHRRELLALAADLLAAPPWRLRGVAAERIVEGLLARHRAPAGT